LRNIRVRLFFQPTTALFGTAHRRFCIALLTETDLHITTKKKFCYILAVLFYFDGFVLFWQFLVYSGIFVLFWQFCAALEPPGHLKV
jgi:hypothetical protein